MSNLRLRELRESAALTKVELAARAGVNERTIRNIESGVFEPSMATAMKLAKALNVPLQALVDGAA